MKGRQAKKSKDDRRDGDEEEDYEVEGRKMIGGKVMKRKIIL